MTDEARNELFDNLVFKGRFESKVMSKKNPENYSGSIHDISLLEHKIPSDWNLRYINVPIHCEISEGECTFKCKVFVVDNNVIFSLNFRTVKTLSAVSAKTDRIRPRISSADEKLIKKNWKLKDNFFIGFIDINEEEGRYRVTDIRRSDFSKITAKVQRDGKEYPFTISGKSDFLAIEQPRKYYKFSWVLRSLDPTPIFYIDTKQPVEIFEPKDIVQCIHDDILDYPGSASQIIVKTLDTLKNQLTASGKEIFIYELLQNANK